MKMIIITRNLALILTSLWALITPSYSELTESAIGNTGDEAETKSSPEPGISPNSEWVITGETKTYDSCQISVYRKAQGSKNYVFSYTFRIDWVPGKLFISDDGKLIVGVKTRVMVVRPENFSPGHRNLARAIGIYTPNGILVKDWLLLEFYDKNDLRNLKYGGPGLLSWAFGVEWFQGSLIMTKPLRVSRRDWPIKNYFLDLKLLEITAMDSLEESQDMYDRLNADD